MDLPKRKRNRLENFSYSQNGIYFLTVCTKNKKCILGRVVGGGDLDAPQMILSDYGKIVEKYICSIENAYDEITLMNYVIMPNHIHLIVMIYSDDNVYRDIETENPANDLIPVMISAFKKLVNKETGFNIWHRSYHDHVIRNESELHATLDYVDTNPVRWKKDRFYCN